MNNSKGNLLLYQTEDGQTKIEVTLANDTVWLTADQMAELFQRNKSTISRHIKNVFESGELKPDMVVAFFATTTQHGAIKGKTQTHTTAFYNLDMIISVGYRVNSHRGVQFRIWATQVLREYLIKGFAMNDDLLKRAGGGNYFDELLSRIRATGRGYADVLQDRTEQDALLGSRTYGGRSYLPTGGCQQGLHGLDLMDGWFTQTYRCGNSQELLVS